MKWAAGVKILPFSWTFITLLAYFAVNQYAALC